MGFRAIDRGPADAIPFREGGAYVGRGLPAVRFGDPRVPYVLARIGHPVMFVTTVLFALRFLRTFEAQRAAREAAVPRAGEPHFAHIRKGGVS